MNKLVVLNKMIRDRYFKLAFYSFFSALTSRTKLNNLYRYFSKRRFFECRKVLRKELKLNDENKKTRSDNLDNCDNWDNVIWTMWYQGYDNAPDIVKDAIQSKKIHSGNHKVVLIDKNNLNEFVEVPHTLIEKTESGIISLAHFSDYIRCELLRKYGGLWIDSTVFVVDNIPEYVFEREFWSIKWEKNREWIASFDKWSVCILAARPESNVMSFCSKLEKEYWEKMDYPITYLLLDMFIAIFYENNNSFRELIKNEEFNNSHIFDFVDDNAKNGNLPLDELEYSRMREDTWIFKLTYKVSYISEFEGKETYYGRVKKEGLLRNFE